MEPNKPVIRRKAPEGTALRRQVRAVLERWLAEAEGFNRSATRLLAVAQLPSVSRAASAGHLNDLENVSGQLAEGSVAFEQACRHWPDDVRQSTRVADVRSSIARSRAILEQARLILEEKTRMTD